MSPQESSATYLKIRISGEGGRMLKWILYVESFFAYRINYPLTLYIDRQKRINLGNNLEIKINTSFFVFECQIIFSTPCHRSSDIYTRSDREECYVFN